MSDYLVKESSLHALAAMYYYIIIIIWSLSF